MRLLATAAATTLALLGLGGGVAQALPGEFDTTFDTDGVRTVDTTPIDVGHDVLVLPDGRIVQSGTNGNGVLVTRYLTDGSLDDGAFGVGYRIFQDTGDGQGVARAPNGDLIVVGTTVAATYNIAVLRIRPDGMLDPGFGTAGVRTVDFGGNETATDVVVQPDDGKIVVSGYTDTGELVVRLNPNGTTDAPGFDVDGKVNLDLSGTSYANAVALAAGGKIVVGGYVRDADSADMTAARLLPNGTPDPSFGDNGVKRIDTGTFDYGYDVLVQPDSKVLVTGGSDQQFVAARLTPGGALDQSFNGGGFAKLNPGGAATALGAVLQANGKVVVSGQVVPAGMSAQQAIVLRLQPGGTLDTTFSFDGLQKLDLPTSMAEAVALQSDGRIVLGGRTGVTNVDVFVARLEGDPPAIGGGPAPNQPSSPGGGGSGGGGSGGGSKAKVPRCAGKKATIVGTNRADKLKGTRRNDVIVALGGNDRVDGGAGNDLICAGNGNDTVKGGKGKDRLYGQSGKDTENGGDGNDRLDGGPGNDRLTGDSGKDSIAGGSGKDRLSGGGGRDSCNGGAGKDRAACERRRSV